MRVCRWWRRLWLGGWRGRRHGALFGTKIGDELIDLIVGEDLAEGGHFDTAFGDLCGNLIGFASLADLVERWSAVGALEVVAVAEGATAISEEDGASELVLFGGSSVGGEGEEDGGKKREQFHEVIFTPWSS